MDYPHHRMHNATKKAVIITIAIIKGLMIYKNLVNANKIKYMQCTYIYTFKSFSRRSHILVEYNIFYPKWF